VKDIKKYHSEHRNEGSKYNTSGSKEYNDSRFKQKQKQKQTPKESLNTKDANLRKSYTSLQNTISEPTERNNTETGVGKYSGSRSHKSNLNLISSTNNPQQDTYEGEGFVQMEFIRPKTSKLDSIETSKQNLKETNNTVEEDVKTQIKHRNIHFKRETGIRMGNLAYSGSEYEHLALKQIMSTMAKNISNSPEHEGVLAASSKIINRKRYLNENSNYYNDFGGKPRRMIQNFSNNAPGNSQRIASRRIVIPTNRLSTSHKSVRRRRKKKKPEFDLSFNNKSTIKQSRSKGYLSILPRRKRIILKNKREFSTTFIK